MLPLGEDVLEIETLYNRPDLTSIYGIAREVAALTGGELEPMPGTTGRGPACEGDERVDIAIDDLEACPRFIARSLRDVTIGESPAWLKARLIGAGMRSISNAVDITNYVMLALGSPLHAYDAETLAGGRIVVRRARPGEELVTLDGTRRELDPADLVIADAERAIGLAGVMGGENTEVSDSTTSVVLETANFEPLTVLRSGERHHMRSESQTRWEKGVDFELAPVAASYATELFAELAGARWTGENEVRADPPLAAADRVSPGVCERGARSRGAGGRAARAARAGSGSRSRHDWTVVSPSWRARDVRRDIDVVEEVARFRLEEVPATLPVRQAMFGRLNHFQRLRRQVEDVLVGAGLYEAYTYSLQAEDPDPDALELPVPLSSQQRLLRTTLTVGLIGAARHNVDMGNHDVELFEVAHVYLPVAGSRVPQERWRLGGILQGGFFRAKGIVEAVFDALHVEPTFERAQVLAGSPIGARVQSGWVAQHGPVGLGLDGEWSAFELDLEDLFALVPERILYRDVITFPPLRQDLAFVVDDNVPAGELLAAAREAAGAELREVRFLSDYRGDQIPAGKKSVAFASRSSRPSARCRTRTRRGSAARSSLRSRRASVPNCAPDARRSFGRFNRGQTPAVSEADTSVVTRVRTCLRAAVGTCTNAAATVERHGHATFVSKPPDVLYHVGSRGVEKRQIFDCAHPVTASTSSSLLAKVVRKFVWQVHAYCSDGEPLPPGARHPERQPLSGNAVPEGQYAQWFNAVAGREGASLRAALLVADRAQRGLRARALALRRPQSRFRAGLARRP